MYFKLNGGKVYLLNERFATLMIAMGIIFVDLTLAPDLHKSTSFSFKSYIEFINT